MPNKNTNKKLVPVLAGPQTKYNRGNLSESLYAPCLGFDLNDPYLYKSKPEYSTLHDPCLKDYFKSKVIKEYLIKQNLLSGKKVVCTLKEFNEHQDYLNYTESINNQVLWKSYSSEIKTFLESQDKGLVPPGITLEDLIEYMLDETYNMMKVNYMPEKVKKKDQADPSLEKDLWKARARETFGRIVKEVKCEVARERHMQEAKERRNKCKHLQRSVMEQAVPGFNSLSKASHKMDLMGMGTSTKHMPNSIAFKNYRGLSKDQRSRFITKPQPVTAASYKHITINDGQFRSFYIATDEQIMKDKTASPDGDKLCRQGFSDDDFESVPCNYVESPDSGSVKCPSVQQSVVSINEEAACDESDVEACVITSLPENNSPITTSQEMVQDETDANECQCATFLRRFRKSIKRDSKKSVQGGAESSDTDRNLMTPVTSPDGVCSPDATLTPKRVETSLIRQDSVSSSHGVATHLPKAGEISLSKPDTTATTASELSPDAVTSPESAEDESRENTGICAKLRRRMRRSNK